MSYFLRKSLRKRGLYLQIYESHYSKEQKKTVTRFVATLGYYEDIKGMHRDPVEHGLSLVRSLNDSLPKGSVGKPRRADIDRTLFVQILKPFELLHKSLAGENSIPLFQERLSRVGDIAIHEDDAGRGMRRVLSRLWESHDSLLRGLTRISNQLGFLGEIEEVGLFPLLASEMSTYILVTDGRFFPLGIIDISKANECMAYRAELSAILPGVPSYVLHGPSSLYAKIPFQARNALSLSLDDSLEKEGARNRAFSIDEARKMVEASLPPGTHVTPSAIAFFVFFANLLMAYQENQEGIPDASR